jgi:hypothetical protein
MLDWIIEVGREMVQAVLVKALVVPQNLCLVLRDDAVVQAALGPAVPAGAAGESGPVRNRVSLMSEERSSRPLSL